MLLTTAADGGKILVVDYYASWCRSCQKLLSHMHQTAGEERFQDVTFASIEFEHCRSLCREKGVRKLPTLEIYRGGELRQRWSGSSPQRLVERLEGEVRGLPEDGLELKKLAATTVHQA